MATSSTSPASYVQLSGARLNPSGSQANGRQVQGGWLTHLRLRAAQWDCLCARVLFHWYSPGCSWAEQAGCGGLRRERWARSRKALFNLQLAYREEKKRQDSSELEGEPIQPDWRIWPAWAEQVEEWDRPVPPVWIHLSYRLPVDGNPNRSLRPVCLFTPPPEGGRAEVWGESVKAARRFYVPFRWAQWGLILVYHKLLKGWRTEGTQLLYAGVGILATDLLDLAVELHKLLTQTLLDAVQLDYGFRDQSPDT